MPFSTSRTLVVLMYVGWAIIGAFMAVELLRVPRSPIPLRPAAWTPSSLPRTYADFLSGRSLLHPSPILNVTPGLTKATVSVSTSGLVTATAGTREAAIAVTDAALELMAASPREGIGLDTPIELVLVLAVEDSESDAGADHTLLDEASSALDGFAAKFVGAVKMRISRVTVHHAGRVGRGSGAPRSVGPAELSDYVNAAEWGLGAGSVSDPLAKVLHLVAILPSSALGPLSLTSHRGEVSAAKGLLVPGWGGICLLPPLVPGSQSSRPVLPEGAAREAMGVLLTQLRSIIGISVYRPRVDSPSGTLTFGADAAAGVAEWEVKELLLSRMARHLVKTEEAIAHLGTMADKLPHLVVRESISVAANGAVQAHFRSQELAAEAKWLEAYSEASRAITSANLAFSDQTLLTTLYFPDENKAAIYLPLFAPLAVPIVRALRRCILAKREKREF